MGAGGKLPGPNARAAEAVIGDGTALRVRCATELRPYEPNGKPVSVRIPNGPLTCMWRDRDG